MEEAQIEAVKTRYKKFFLTKLKDHVQTAEIDLEITAISKDTIHLRYGKNSDNISVFKTIEKYNRLTGQSYKKVITGFMATVITFKDKYILLSKSKIFIDNSVTKLMTNRRFEYDYKTGVSAEKLAKVFCTA